MDTSTESETLPYYYNNVQAFLSHALDHARRQSPERFPKPIYVLEPVDAKVDGLYEHRLRQVKKDQSEECFTLIPYYFGEFHWIGVLLKFKIDGQITRAEFIDPVEQSKFVAKDLRKQFAKVYPNISLKERNIQNHDSKEQSATLIVENVLESATEDQSNGHNTSDSQMGTEANHLTSTVLKGKCSKSVDLEQISNDEPEKLEISRGSTSSVIGVSGTEQPIKHYDSPNSNNTEKKEESLERFEHLQGFKNDPSDRRVQAGSSEIDDSSRLPDLKERMTIGLTNCHLQDISELPEEIQESEKRIEQFKKRGRTDDVNKESEHLNNLKELQELANEIDKLNSKSESSKSSDETKRSHLEKSLRISLVECHLNDASELSEEIQESEKRIEQFKKRGRTDDVNKESEYLNKLKQLQDLAAEINNLNCKENSSDNIEENKRSRLEETLRIGLEECHLNDASELSEEIQESEKRIEQFKKRSRTDDVNKESEYLSKLKRLQDLANEINDLNCKENSSGNIEENKRSRLEKTLRIGLEQCHLNDASELSEEIQESEKRIEQFQKRGRIDDVKKESEYLDKLRKLQGFVSEIDKLNSNSESSKSSDETKRSHLDESLRIGLVEYHLNDPSELSEEIQESEKRIEQFKKRGRTDDVNKESEHLSKLKQLHEIVNEINNLNCKENSSRNIEENKRSRLEETLRIGLEECHLNDASELSEEIQESEKRIEQFKKRGRTDDVNKESEHLSKLKDLHNVKEQLDCYKSNDLVNESGVVKNNSLDEEEHPITVASIENMYNDFSSMPSCSVRSISCLMYYILLKLIGSSISMDHNIKIRRENEPDIVKELECLQERIKIEELGSTEIHDLIQAASVYIKNENWKETLTILRKLYKQIQPLDIHELFRLIEKVDDAAHLIKDKDIILFLGGTGSGKSTTIHFLSGSKMVEKQVAGMNHIAPTEIKNCELKSITTSPFSRSETRHITPVTVNFKDVGGYKNATTILCDSPGFEDTNGPEVDIANGLGIVKAIKGCRSIKPVVLCSFRSIGDRCNGIKDLAHVLVGLIPGIKDHMTTFSYIFTKFPESERETIHATLVDITDKLNDVDKLDISYTELLMDMLQKTESGARVLNPIKDKPGKLLYELAQSKTISHPKEVFQFSISEKSKSIVREQVRKHQLSVMSATAHSDYKFIKYKLDQLKRLNGLLGQDYIEQIYNNCIQYISKHLTNEYQEAISALNHFIINETVSNIEDIEQYQIRFEHAKLAEDVRKEHLGKDAIHSSAFIQHLRQQFDIILENLLKKDINDLSVKASLDKIKILSNSFTDLDSNKYKNACQSLTQKFDSIGKSFKESVQSNQFDACANNLTILFEASINLNEHLKSEYMTGEYQESKKYFFKYLNDSTEQLSFIFDQEKIGTDDVESLNKCVRMLETVNSIYTLESHIAKTAISEIYENLLSKILNHVDKIIISIEIEFNNANSFQVLEHYMAELDLIRKISTIELRTLQSYCSTLEKLIGYIQRSKGDVETQLKTLLRREGKVDYDKLIKCLSSLKGAKWIEKYRKEIYSDVINDVEQQIIQHCQILKDSIIDVNLDLDNFDKIEPTYKIIVEINEMKPLEKLVPGLNEQIKEVNTWFINVTNNIFILIENTFNIEKWREENYQILDSNKLEKAFHYLDICKRIRILFKTNCISVLNHLEQFVRYFSTFIQKEMENCFENIKQYQINKNKEELFEKARTLASRLQQIFEIEAKYPRIFSCYPNEKIIGEWKNELSSYLTELSDEMAKLSATQRAEPLSVKLLISKTLSKLDSFLDDEKFIDVYYKYQSQFFTQTNDVCKQVIDAIKSTDYERVALEMAVLQSSNEVGEHFLKQAKRALTVGVDNLMEDTKIQAIMLGNNIEIEGVKSIVENLKRIQRAEQFVSQYLDKTNVIKTCVTEVKGFIEVRIKRFLEGVAALITINNFYEADKKIESITLVRTLLGNYCTQDVFRDIETLKERLNKVVSEDVVKKYSEMDIGGYFLNPPTDIFAKFGEVNNTNPIYNQALNTIKEKILEKFRKELDVAKSKQPPNPENPHIRKFESAVKYLPDAMKNALEVELKHCKDDIALLIQDNDVSFDRAFSSGKLQNIKGLLQGYQEADGMQCYVNKGRERVLKQLQDIAMKINQNLEKNDIIQVLYNVEIMFSYKIELEDVVVEIKQIYLEVRCQIKDTIREAYLCFMNRFLKTKTSIITNETVQMVEKSFLCLIEFMKFAYEHKGQPIVVQMFSEDFNQQTNELNKHILQYISKLHKQYKDALEKLDVASLNSSLNTVNQWNSLFLKMKSHDSLYSINDFSVKSIVMAISELPSYPQILEAVSQKLKDLREELNNQELINNETKEFNKRRDEFYDRLNEKFLSLSKAKQLDIYGLSIDINKLEQDCLESLGKKLQKIFSAIQTFLEKFSTDDRLTGTDYDNFHLYYSNLISFRQEMKVKDDEVNKKIEDIEKVIFDKIQTWQNAIEGERVLQNVTNSLLNMKRASNNIPSFKSRINERIDETINQYKNEVKELAVVGKLGTILKQDKTGVGQSLISEHKAFQGYSLSLFNEKTRRHGIEYVLNNLTGDLINQERLKNRYDEFDKKYKSLVEQYLQPDMDLKKLIADVKAIVGDIRQKAGSISWDATVRNIIPNLVAYIFALWTLKNAEHYYEAEGIENRENYLLQPHAAQVVSIFRMLGIGDAKEELKNNLVQIGTGEGKSVTLGVTASVLALLGFDVSCACYSEYLSQRDYLAFSSLFDSLGLINYIHYGTFNKLCENIINENGEIRQTIEQLISVGSNNSIQNSQQIKRAKMLLIDEVDVFFSRDFYGNVYTPSASLKDPTIKSLVNFIWINRKADFPLSDVMNTDEYKACCKRFPDWESLIKEAIKDMLVDVHNFQSHDYVVHQDKIGYIEQDNTVYNVVYGYKTLFAYHYEHEKGRISKESLDANISIRIKCGSFSYAEIPLQFAYIMGVTGTLATLSEPEKRVIENVYHVNKKTYIPSVFGKNNLKFVEKDDIMIESIDDYFNAIRQEIDMRLKRNSLETRAVLVLFESKQKLKEFYDSKALEPIKDSVVYLTEEASLTEKENLIKRTTTCGQITLFTRTFGRGTDFICQDQNLLDNGGTHVIQTFLSEEVSEEVQIKGRTARQGNHGSYSMILLDRDLEKFQIEKEHIENIKKGIGVSSCLAGAISSSKIYNTVYALLDDRRTDLFKTQYEANMKYVEEAKKKHVIAQKFLLYLHSGDMNSVKKFLIAENRGVRGHSSSRTVCLMDATGSMSHLLHKCKNTVGTMFERASEVLKENNIDIDSFQIQFAVYRNYSSGENKILQSSSWETRPDNLRAFMNTINVQGGQGNEAIEIGLWHANKENEREKITQVILIGDAPPNTKSEVSYNRTNYKKDDWKNTKFLEPTYYEDELKKLTLNKIPVHAFYVAKRAENSFRSIASKTGGRCELLDINSSSGSQMLTDLVTREILRNVGGSTKGDALVEAYNRKFGKSYK